MNESQSYRRDTDEITEQPLRVELLCDGSALPPTPDPSTAIPERDFSLHSGERQTAEALDGIRCDHRARYEKAADTIRNQFSDTESLFGLDIFCGTGYGAFLVNQLLGCSVLGIEGSSEAVTFANEHFPGKNLYYVYKRFPFELPSSIFDFVLCYESLEHVEDDGALLQNMAQTLKPRGFLFISVPNEAINSLSRNPNRFHFRHYHHKDITGRLSASFNLEIISWYGQNVYRMNEGVVCGLLDDTEMKLIEKSEGQFNVYVCRKRN
jgi:SAM-dependent methyltransferase